ncbi:hypothetical protein ACFL2E_01340 [Thermodesulfobacteriota bacterium]
MNRISYIGAIIILTVVFTAPFSLAGKTVTAWGTLQIEGHALGFNVTGATITLQCAPNPVIKGFHKKFEFSNVPTGVPCQLIIQIQSPTTGGNVEYRASYKFNKAPLVAGLRGKKVSGYLGDFLYNIQENKIKNTTRY